MSEDQDVKEMFDATRHVDSAMVPPFDEVLVGLSNVSESHADGEPGTTHSARLVSILAAIVVSVLVATFIRSRGPNNSARTDAQAIGQICDELTARIATKDLRLPQEDIREMEWTTSTDTLLPIGFLRFDGEENR